MTDEQENASDEHAKQRPERIVLRCSRPGVDAVRVVELPPEPYPLDEDTEES